MYCCNLFVKIGTESEFLISVVHGGMTVTSVETWMAINRLNPAKTDVIWLWTSRRVQQCTTDPLQLHGASIKPYNCVRDLGVVVDSGLTLVDHVTHITNVFLPHSPTLAHPTLLDSRHCS